ncbi:MAG: hypothetical protein PHH61_05460 [Candidatus Nanoarchaeia archaeon]|nr:hypothetical protein [Candidatus Nanoarchaeia archaeon]
MGKRGETTLSKAMLDSMGLKPGDILKLRSFDEYLFLKKISEV